MNVEFFAWPSDLTSLAASFGSWMSAMFWQVIILVAFLSLVSWCIGNRVSARFRYGLWLIVPVRLVLPPTLALIVGWGWWCLPANVEPEMDRSRRNESVALNHGESLPKSIEKDELNSLSPGRNDLTSSVFPNQDYEAHHTSEVTTDLRPEMPIDPKADQTQNPDGYEAESATVFSLPMITRGFTWQAMALAAWFLIFSVLVFRIVRGIFCVNAMVKRSIPVDLEVETLAETCRMRVGLKHDIRILSSTDVTTPMLVGVFHPVILLPKNCEKILNESELESVFVHELQHIKRWDPVIHFVNSLLTAVYWFHPAVWLAQHKLRQVRELACDEATLATLTSSRKSYASGLIKVAELISRKQPAPAVGFVERKDEMTNRIVRILDTGTRAGKGISLAGVIAIVTIGLVAIPGAARPSAIQPKPLPIRPAMEDNGSNSTHPVNLTDETRTDEEIIASLPYQPMVTVGGVVFNEEGEPAKDASVYLRFWEKIRTFKTDKKGRFRISVPLIATNELLVRASNSEGSLQDSVRLGRMPKAEQYQNLKLNLKPPFQFKVKVRTRNGAPVEGARVGCINSYLLFSSGLTNDKGQVNFKIPQNLRVDYLFAFSKKGVDYLAFIHKRAGTSEDNAVWLESEETIYMTLAKTNPVSIVLKDDEGNPLANKRVSPSRLRKPGQTDSIYLSFFSELVRSKSNAKGIAKFDWIPDWPNDIHFYHQDYRFSGEPVIVKKESQRSDYEMTLTKKVSVTGQVSLKDGRPAANLHMLFQGHGPKDKNNRSRYGSANVFTDEHGKFEMHVSPNLGFIGSTLHNELKFNPPAVFAVEDKPRDKELKLTVEKGTRVFGNVTIAVSSRRIPNHELIFAKSTSTQLPLPDGQFFTAFPVISQKVKTDQNGNYELFLGPGHYSIQTRKKPGSQKKMEIVSEREMKLNIALDRPETSKLTGRVLDAKTGNPIGNAEIHGVYASQKTQEHRFLTRTDPMGAFTVDRELVPTVTQVKSKDGKLAAVVKLSTDDKLIEIKLSPTITAKGRLVNSEGRPLAGEKLRFYRRVDLEKGSFKSPFGLTVVTDRLGNFEAPQLVPGMTYTVAVILEEMQGLPVSSQEVRRFKSKVGDSQVDLGDMKYIRFPLNRN